MKPGNVEIILLRDQTLDTDLARGFWPYDRNGQATGEKIFIPRSQIYGMTTFAKEEGRFQECRVEVPEWLAEKKELI